MAVAALAEQSVRDGMMHVQLVKYRVRVLGRRVRTGGDVLM